MILIVFLVFLGILFTLILAHECGHFFAAKKIGVRVEEFGFGFPPRIFGIRKGETVYSLNLVPLGGFVRIKGEAGEHNDEKDSFSSRPIRQRAIMLLSGVFMNVMLTVALLFIGFMVGLPQVVDETVDPGSIKDYRIQIAEVVPNFPAHNSDIRTGDNIVSVDGNNFYDPRMVSEFVAGSGGRELKVAVKRGAQMINLKVKPILHEGRFVLGVKLLPVGLVRYGPLDAFVNAVLSTASFFKETVIALAKIIKGAFVERKLASDLGGPVAIAVLTAQVVNLGLGYVIQFAALLSLNLAIINILPFPALDGGRALFLLVEKIRRKPLSHRIEAWIHNAGFGLLMAFVVLITYKDFIRFGDKIMNALKSIV